MRLSFYFGKKMTCEIYCFPNGASSTYAFDSLTSTKRQGNMLSTKIDERTLLPWGRMVRGDYADGLHVRRISYGSSFLARFVSDLHEIS
jgi:hypothetical protein